MRKDDARAHEIMLCIQTGKTMSDINRMRFTQPEFYMKTRAEMLGLFGEMEDSLDPPGRWAARGGSSQQHPARASAQPFSAIDR